MNGEERESSHQEPETSTPMAVVRQMFEAFGRGDVRGILETVHAESRWIYIGANPEPRRASLHGHEGVGRFFQRILDRLDMRSFEPREFILQGPTVVVFGSESGVVRKTREPFHNEWVQKYVVRNGKITEMEEFNIAVEEADRSGRSDSAESRGRENRIDDALKMTFPASDPPSWPSSHEAGSSGRAPERTRSGTIAVTGATGHLGRLVVADLLERGIPPGHVRALARSPEKAAGLAQRGVQVRRADYTEIDSLRTALDGVDKLLLISSSEVGQRVRHHENVIDAAVEAGAGLIVYTSILAAAAAEVLTGRGHASRVYELGGEVAFTLPELAETISRLSGRRVEYRDLPEEKYAGALIGAGLPKPFARVLADSDRGIARGELFTESDDLRRLIGRPTTSPDEAVRDALELREGGDAPVDHQEATS